MIEPLAHVVKGSVSRYTVLSTSTGNTRLGALKNNLFPPLPRPLFFDSPSLATSSSHPPLEPTAQCRIWSCCPIRHSIWCPSQELHWELDSTSRPRGRKSRLRSFSRHLPRLSPHSPPIPLTLHGQRRHASVVPQELEHRLTSPGFVPPAHHPMSLTSKSPEVVEFLRYRYDGELMFNEPTLAYKACKALLDAQLLYKVPIDDRLSFCLTFIGVAVYRWSRDASAPAAQSAKLVETIVKATRLPKTDPRYRTAEILRARCLAIAGRTKYAMNLLREHPARADTEGPMKHELIELYNTLFVATYRTQPYENFLSLVAAEERRFAPIFFSDVRSMPIKRVFTGLLHRKHPFKEYAPCTESEAVNRMRAIVSEIQAVHPDQKMRHQRKPEPPPTPTAKPPDAEDFESPAEAEKRFAAYRVPTPFQLQSLLKAYARAGDAVALRRRFEELFYNPSSLVRAHRLRTMHFYPAFQLMLESNVPKEKAMRYWNDRLKKAGLSPDAYIQSHILRYYTKHDLAKSAVKVFEEIKAENGTADFQVYQTALTYFSRRGDIGTVESLYQQLIEDDIKPDKHILLTVMNAHVEAGTWAGVLKVHEHMKSLGMDDTIEVFNVVFKASHLIGIPYSVLVKQFANLESMNLIPDAYTYSILIQAAIDAENVVAAFKHGQEMISRPYILMSPHVFTILIDAALQRNLFKRAQWTYRKMTRLGVKPTSITFGKMLSYIANLGPGNEERESMIIEEIRQRVQESDDWKVPSYGRSAWFEHIYVPLMGMALKNGSIDKAKAAYDAVVALGEQPSLTMNIMLLDAHRCSSDIQAVLELWPRIFKQAVAIKDAGLSLQSEEILQSMSDTPSDIMVKALSIYLDALSRAGLHSEVPTACDLYSANGFKFDAHIWNHLAIALIRGGNPGGAFEVVNNIILPYRRASLSYTPLNSSNPSSPRVFISRYTAGLRSPASTRLTISPLRRLTKRKARARVTRDRLGNYSALPLRRPTGVFEEMFESLATYEHWRVHRVVSQILLSALNAMEAGYPIRAIQPGETQLPAMGEFDREAAKKQLKDIRSGHTRARRFIKLFKIVERQRLGDEFDAEYKPIREEHGDWKTITATEEDNKVPKEKEEIPVTEEEETTQREALG